MSERLYLVAYDIRDRRRWRRVHRLLEDAGTPVQLSVFQCRLDKRRLDSLMRGLAMVIDPAVDAVLLADLGPAASAGAGIRSLGVPFVPSRLETLIV